MNIQTAKGSKVLYTFPNAGSSQERVNCKRFLRLGDSYVVDRVEFKNWSVQVYLEGFSDIPFPISAFSDMPLSGVSSNELDSANIGCFVAVLVYKVGSSLSDDEIVSIAYSRYLKANGVTSSVSEAVCHEIIQGIKKFKELIGYD